MIHRYEYVAPPEPAPVEGVTIEVPEKSGTPVTVLTFENGMTAFVYRAMHDAEAADRMTAWIDQHADVDATFFGFPNSFDPSTYFWVPRATMETLLNIHDAISGSPIAASSEGQVRRKQILVPMGDGVVPIPQHGPGKRRNN